MKIVGVISINIDIQRTTQILQVAKVKAQQAYRNQQKKMSVYDGDDFVMMSTHFLQ